MTNDKLREDFRSEFCDSSLEDGDFFVEATGSGLLVWIESKLEEEREKQKVAIEEAVRQGYNMGYYHGENLSPRLAAIIECQELLDRLYERFNLKSPSKEVGDERALRT